MFCTYICITGNHYVEITYKNEPQLHHVRCLQTLQSCYEKMLTNLVIMAVPRQPDSDHVKQSNMICIH